MLKLEASAVDDPAFLDLASRLIAGAARVNGFTALVVAHIDHWFGPRWLGFRGKLLGAAGVRSHRLTGTLAPPPFHPHRVRSVREYPLAESGAFECRGDVRWLHGFRTSQANIDRHMWQGQFYAWYSGDTAGTGKGVVMAYPIHRKWSAAWYVGFDRVPEWHLSQTVAIAPRRVQELMERVVPEQRQAEPAAAPDPPRD
jgi:hypothetical protein